MANLPAPSQSAASGNNGGGRKPATPGAARSGFSYIKVENMSATPKVAKIMDLKIPPDPPAGQRKFNDIVLKIYYNGAIWLWGLKTSNPQYGTLISMLGSDSDAWIDQEFLLGTETEEFGGRVFAHIEPAPKAQAAKANRTR